jgi:hypothetical protein
MNRFVPAAALATLALALTACSDPSEAYTPVDQLPSASDPAGSPPTTTTPTPTPPPVEGDNATDPVDVMDPMDPMNPTPVPVDPEVPPPMDPVPPIEDATRPPPVDPTLEQDPPVQPTT